MNWEALQYTVVVFGAGMLFGAWLQARNLRH